MQYNQNPSVIHTDPKRFATNVHVAAKITIGFDSDIEKTSIAGNIHLYNSAGKPIEVRCSYREKVVTVTPREKLSSEETYRVVVQGDNNPAGSIRRGIHSIIGTYMQGDYEFVFTTKNQLDSLENIVDGYPHDIVINVQPEFRYHIAELTGAETAVVEIQLSKTKVFDNVLWTGTGTPEDGKKGIKCGIVLTDAVYYWRARVVRAENQGTWSDSFQFHLNTIPRVPVVEDDTIPLDPVFPSDWDISAPVVLTTYPDDNQAAVPLNQQVIAVVIDGLIPVEQIDFDSIYLTCEPNISFTNAGEGAKLNYRTKFDHDDIMGDIDVVYNTHDNTTTLILKLSALPESELLDFEHTIQGVYNLIPWDYEKRMRGRANVIHADYAQGDTQLGIIQVHYLDWEGHNKLEVDISKLASDYQQPFEFGGEVRVV
jgi:hypothetical protein